MGLQIGMALRKVERKARSMAEKCSREYHLVQLAKIDRSITQRGNHYTGRVVCDDTFPHNGLFTGEVDFMGRESE